MADYAIVEWMDHAIVEWIILFSAITNYDIMTSLIIGYIQIVSRIVSLLVELVILITVQKCVRIFGSSDGDVIRIYVSRF